MDTMTRLVEIMARLRGPDGCPWDREQTPGSLRTYVIEEAPGSKMIRLNGAVAHLGKVGDLLVIMSFAQVDPVEAQTHKAKILVLGGQNHDIVKLEEK